MVIQKQKILDMGAGANPYPRATHAIDATKKLHPTKEEINFYKAEHGKNLETKLKQMDYKIKINYNTQKLPWPDNSFKMVYSNGSLAENGNLHAYKEAYRVLKHGGKLKYGMIVGTKQEIQKKMQLPQKAGFINVHTGKIYVTPKQTKNKGEILATDIIATKP